MDDRLLKHGDDSARPIKSKTLEYGPAANPEHKSPTKTISRDLWLAVLLITSQSFIWGYGFSCLNPCLAKGNAESPSDCFDGNESPTVDDAADDAISKMGPGGCPLGSIYNDVRLTTLQISSCNAFFVCGGWCGAVLSCYFSDAFGRKRTIVWNTVLIIVGAIVSAVRVRAGESNGDQLALLYVGRLLNGLAAGVISCVCPVLLSELGSDINRASITAMHQFLMSFGILWATVMGFVFVEYVEHGWQFILVFQLVPAVLLILTQNLMPESPKWFLLHNREHEALDVLNWIRGDNYDTRRELELIKTEILEAEQPGRDVSWETLFQSKRALLIGCGLMIFQEFSGFDTVVFYSTVIFGYAGFKQNILATASVGVVNFLSTILAVYLVGSVAWKKLLLAGQAIMVVSLMCLGSFLLGMNYNPDLQGILAVVCVLMFIAAFAVSLGSVVWVIMAEVVPHQLRDKAYSVFLNVSWLCVLCTSLGTLEAIDGLGGVNKGMSDEARDRGEKRGAALLYFILFGVSVGGMIFVQMMIPNDIQNAGSRTPSLLEEE